MSKVSEKPTYTDYSHAKVGAPVSIIEAQYVKAKYGRFSDPDYGHEFSTNDSKFMDGVLKDMKVISEKGYGGIVEYTVQLNSGEEKTFKTSPREYYFKVFPKPAEGGRRRHSKGKSRKAHRRRRTTRRR